MCLHLRPLKLSGALEWLESALGSAGSEVQQTESNAFLFQSKGWGQSACPIPYKPHYLQLISSNRTYFHQYRAIWDKIKLQIPLIPLWSLWPCCRALGNQGWGINSSAGSCGSTRGAVMVLKIQPELSPIVIVKAGQPQQRGGEWCIRLHWYQTAN